MTKAQSEAMRSDAFDWGRSVGEVRYQNKKPRGNAKGTGLRGSFRDSFLLGLITGYTFPRKR